MTSNSSPKSYSYCFTVNNYSDEDLNKIKALEKNPKCRYYVIGRETGDNGTPHLQGYVYFKNQTVLSTVSKLLPRAHLEVTRGTFQQAIDYCKKDGDSYEWGEPPVSQKRKGELGAEYWTSQKKLAIEGKVDQMDAKLFVTHYRTIKCIQADFSTMPPDLDDIDNYWYYGTTGTGKSFKARSENPGFYLKMCNKWWDGYTTEETVIIEDFDKAHAMLGHHLKIWADRYSFPAEVKGSKVNLRPKRIIVTSNWHPSEIWPHEPQTLEPIQRRFKITHFSAGLVPSP